MKSYGRNWGTKIIAVLLAVVLWLFVFGQQTPANIPEFTRTLADIPVEIIGADRNYQYLVTPSSVDIVIRGSQEFINSMIGRDHTVTVDVRGKQEGIHNIEVATNIAGGVTQAIVPNYVTVIVDPITTIEVGVSVETVGTLPEGVELKDIIVKPSTVELTGPKRELERVSSVVAQLDLSEIESSQEKTVSITPMDIQNKNVDSLQLNISSVIIEIVLQERFVERDFPLNYINLGEELTVTLSQENVSSIIPVEMEAYSVQPYVDLEGLEEGTHTIEVQSNINELEFEPAEIQVTIERE